MVWHSTGTFSTTLEQTFTKSFMCNGRKRFYRFYGTKNDNVGNACILIVTFLSHYSMRFLCCKQRIALVYMVVALIEALTAKYRQTDLVPGHFSIFTAYQWQW